MKLPDKFLSYLSEYGVVQTDHGEPVGWGHHIQKHMDPELWEELKAHGKTIKVDPSSMRQDYVVVTDWLSFEDALAKYGPVTAEEFGPYGRWWSTTLGINTFSHEGLRPIWNRKRPPKELPSTTGSALLQKKTRKKKTPKKSTENKA